MQVCIHTRVYIYTNMYMYTYVYKCVWMYSIYLCLHESRVQSPNISASDCCWYVAYPQVRIPMVLDSLRKWNSKLNNDKRKGKDFHYQKNAWIVPTHFKTLEIPRNTRSLSHTVSIPTLWKWKLQCALYTEKKIPTFWPYLKNIFQKNNFFSIPFFHPILHQIF